MGVVGNFAKKVAQSLANTGATTIGGFTPYVPSTFAEDFDAYLNALVPHANYSFSVAHDWYATATRPSIRGMIFPVNWKSKYSGSDTASNFRTSHKYSVYKGDILIRNDGAVYMIVWSVEPDVASQKSQAQLCNVNITFQRWHKQILNADTGEVITQAGFEDIVSDMPSIAYSVQNKVQYEVVFNTPGITPEHLATVYVQYNSNTDQLQIGDEFDWVKNRYKILDITYDELDVTRTFGILTLTVQKVSGGSL